MNKIWLDHGVDVSGNHIFTCESAELEFDAQANDRAPVDPWGNTIKWGAWTQEWDGEDFIGYSLNVVKDGQPQRLHIFND